MKRLIVWRQITKNSIWHSKEYGCYPEAMSNLWMVLNRAMPWWNLHLRKITQVAEVIQRGRDWHIRAVGKSLQYVKQEMLGASGKESACQCRKCKRHRLNLLVGKISWRRKWHPSSSILAWRIPWTEEPGGLQSMGSQRVGHTEHLNQSQIRRAHKWKRFRTLWQNKLRRRKSQISGYVLGASGVTNWDRECKQIGEKWRWRNVGQE